MLYFLFFLYVCMCAFPLIIYAIEEENKNRAILDMDLQEFMKWKKTKKFPIK